HTRFSRDWSSDVCSSDLALLVAQPALRGEAQRTGLEQVTLAGLEVVVLHHQGAAHGLGLAEQAEAAAADFEFVVRFEFMRARRQIGRAACRERVHGTRGE